MNIYNCWYQGNLGYACRTRGKKWMFVPELGQPDNNIYRHLSVNDLLFKNKSEKRYEMEIDPVHYGFSPLRLLKKLLFPAYKPVTVGGLLLCTN